MTASVHAGMMARPSVTQAIGFCNQGAFANIPADILQAASERGTALHNLARAHALNLWIPTIPAEVQGYFDSFRRWFDRYTEKTIMAEEECYHPTLFYTGTPDWVGIIRGDEGRLTLVDWKTPLVASKGWRLQLAAYKALVESHTGLSICRVASLQPRRDGRVAKFIDYPDSLSRDVAVFMSVLTVWRFFND